MSTGKKIKELKIEIKLGDKITAKLDGGILKLKGSKNEVENSFKDKSIKIEVEGKAITLKASKFSKVNKKHIKSYAAHIKNMVRGCEESHKYKLKICSGHFPMNVSVAGDQIVVKNFLGEKVPRTLKLKPGAVVKVEGELVFVESPNKEIAGQVSADIEQLTRRTGYDTRIFQDGIWIIEKDGREIG
jgi:large subunit ribosomal protein L6